MKKNSHEACARFLASGAAELGLAVEGQVIDTLCRYFQELDKWGRKMNLVAPWTEMESLLAGHFLDSLSLLPHLPDGEFSLLDVGSGAGFPGLVLKVARPDMALTVVEPRGKRVSFLRHICRTLALADVEIIPARLEGPDQHGLTTFDIITCRAFMDVAHFLPLVESYLAPAGRIICMKGPRAVDELAVWQQLATPTKLRHRSTHSVPLPYLAKNYQLLVFARQSED